MLVLTCGVGEPIRIIDSGGLDTIVILSRVDQEKRRVRMGFDAPPEVTILRHDAKQREPPDGARRQEEAELVYLACPYSHANSDTRLGRFGAANFWAAELMRRGLLVFSPLSHCVPICSHGVDHDWMTWRRFCRAMLRRSGRMIVLMLPGWKHSAGVRAEIEIMEAIGRPIEYLDVGTDPAAEAFVAWHDKAEWRDKAA